MADNGHRNAIDCDGERSRVAITFFEYQFGPTPAASSALRQKFLLCSEKSTELLRRSTDDRTTKSAARIVRWLRQLDPVVSILQIF
jgi:hypothetical protein